MELTIEMTGLKVASESVGGLHDRVMNLRPILTELVPDIHDAEKKQFATSGAYGGKSWAPLSPEWSARKAKKGQDPRILRMTGAMEAALTHRGAPGGVERVTSDELFVGSNLKYVRAVDAKRKVVAVSPEDLHEMGQRIQRYIMAGTVKK